MQMLHRTGLRVGLTVALGFILVACSGTEVAQIKPTPTPTPKWTHDDVRVELRDHFFAILFDRYLGIERNVAEQMQEWAISYDGDGWWVVEGEAIGREAYSATQTPDPESVPTPTPLPPGKRPGACSSHDIYRDYNLYVRCIELKKAYDNAVAYYTATPIVPIVPTPTPLTLRRLTSGVWKISERTKNVLAESEPAIDWESRYTNISPR